MRPIDEILWSYPSQDAPARRYLVRRLERQPVTVDAAVPASLLAQAEGGDVGDYARLAEDAFFSRREEDRLRRAGGDPPRDAGSWTRFLGQADAEIEKVAGVDLERAANVCLTPLVGPLASQLQQGGARAAAGLKILARVRVPASLEAIEGISGIGANAAGCMAAYSVFGGAEAAGRALALARKSQGTPVFAGLLHALRGVPTAETFALLEGVAGGPARYHAAVASALEGFEDFGYQPVLDKVMSGAKDPWTLMHGIESMGRLGASGLLPRATAVMKQIDHPLVQVVCLQALAEAREREGAKLAMAALGSKNPVVQAAAVECLIRLPVPRQEYSERVLQLLDTPHPKLAMNVALACVVLDPRRATKRVKDLLSSGNAQLLLQGVHCLAYMDYPSAAGILNQIVHKAPAGPMRIQAVRALGRRAADDPQTVGVLAKLLESDDASVRQTVAWFLAGAHPASRKGVAGLLAKMLPREGHAPTAGVMAEALGMLGPDAAGTEPALGQLAKGIDDRARSAAWALATAFPESEEAVAMDAAPRAVTRAYGCLRRWVTGDTDVGTLAGLLASGDEREMTEIAQVARVLAETAVFAEQTTRLKPLARALSELHQSASTAEPVVVDVEDLDGPTTATAAEIRSQPTGTAGKVEMDQVLGTGRKPARAAYGGGEVQVKTGQNAGVGLSALVSEEDAAAAMEAAKDVSSEDMDAAVRKATYFAGDEPVAATPAGGAGADPGVLQGGAPQGSGSQGGGAPTVAYATATHPAPASRGELLWTIVQLTFFAGVAIALGRLVRMLVLGGY